MNNLFLAVSGLQSNSDDQISIPVVGATSNPYAVANKVKETEFKEMDADLSLMKADIHELTDNTTKTLSAVRDLSDDVQGCESLLAAERWSPAIFGRVYNHAAKVSALFGHESALVSGTEDLNENREELVAGVQGFGAAVKAGVETVIKMIKATFVKIKEFFKGLFDKKDKVKKDTESIKTLIRKHQGGFKATLPTSGEWAKYLTIKDHAVTGPALPSHLLGLGESIYEFVTVFLEIDQKKSFTQPIYDKLTHVQNALVTLERTFSDRAKRAEKDGVVTLQSHAANYKFEVTYVNLPKISSPVEVTRAIKSLRFRMSAYKPENTPENIEVQMTEAAVMGIFDNSDKALELAKSIQAWGDRLEKEGDKFVKQLKAENVDGHIVGLVSSVMSLYTNVAMTYADNYIKSAQAANQFARLLLEKSASADKKGDKNE